MGKIVSTLGNKKDIHCKNGKRGYPFSSKWVLSSDRAPMNLIIFHINLEKNSLSMFTLKRRQEFHKLTTVFQLRNSANVSHINQLKIKSNEPYVKTFIFIYLLAQLVLQYLWPPTCQVEQWKEITFFNIRKKLLPNKLNNN